MKLFKRELNKERILNAWVLFTMRQGRGSGLINQLRYQEYMVLGASIIIIFPSMPKILLIPLAIAWLIFTYMLGYLDEKKIKLWQLELERNATWVDPYKQRIDAGIKRINKRLNKIEKRN